MLLARIIAQMGIGKESENERTKETINMKKQEENFRLKSVIKRKDIQL